MVEFVDFERGENGDRLRDFYVVLFDGSILLDFPWGEATFDCVLVSADHQRTRQLAQKFANQIVRCNIDWVQTTGPDAEYIHDLVDEASVRAGIQQRVGEGRPMTSWHNDYTSLEQISEVAQCCPGGSDYVLCAVVGSPTDLQEFVACLRRALNSPE